MNKKKENKTIVEVKQKSNAGLIIAFSILCGVVLALAVLLYSSYTNANYYASSLEGTYQKSYYDLVDDINNAEIKMSKVVSTDDDAYAAKLLQEISKNANDAQNNLNVLPVSINGIDESRTFVNQLSGYCETLSKKVAKGGKLTAKEKQTLKQLYSSIISMKQALNEMTNNMSEGYSILGNSLSLEKDYNDFTVQLQSIKSNDIEYPTMIYDGPFADSQIRKEVKKLAASKNVVNETKAKENLSKICGISVENINSEGEAKSNFETYNFSFKDLKGKDCYAQISKTEGRLITLAGNSDEGAKNVSMKEAQEIAKDFIKKTGVNDVQCVWSDDVGGNGYFNFAPVENGIILYPDLIKVKCDLADGDILGYEARSYYTNNVKRNLNGFAISKETALSKIQDGFTVKAVNKALCPIEYNEELCYEIECTKQDDTYYFYINAMTGSVDNILKVIKTNDGNKIM